MKKLDLIISWLKRHKILISRLVLLVLFFILPFSKLILLSGIPIPVLNMIVHPPGYPVEGKEWDIEIWGSLDNGRTWIPVSNATIEVNTSMEGMFTLFSDEDGKVSFTYLSEIGIVSFRSFHEKYGSCEWIPQIRFVDNNVARYVILFFGIGSPSIIWQVLSKNKRKDPIEKILYYILLVSSVAGWLLSFYWFWQWKWGTEWGFGNRIVTLYFPIYFDPHLVAISMIVIASTFLTGMKTVFFDRTAKAKTKAPEYIS